MKRYTNMLSKHLLTAILLAFALTCVAKVYSQENITLLSHIEHEVLTNDIWGYVDSSGGEYAIVGTRIDARIYELSDPSNPKLIAQIPGSTSIWRDFKSYGNYIYQTTDQGNDGLRIIDMSYAPDSVGTKLWDNKVNIEGQDVVLSTCHNIWIDTKNGLAFLAGCRAGAGGALILDLKEDPLNPKFIGAENETYAHDVITQGNLLFTSEIYEGNLGIYDISDIQNPVLLSRTQTSSQFTHNAWPSDDGKYIFTTDERGNAYVDAFDITDLKNPVFLDKYQPVANQGVVPHNAHYYNGFLVVSWYTEGVIILDVTKPDNMIKVGQYDTDPNNIDGCWGVYPFLPSGLIIASDLGTGFWVLKPNYLQAARIEGKVVSANDRMPIVNATVEISGLNSEEFTNSIGEFKTGTTAERTFDVRVSHPLYETKVVSITTKSGETNNLYIELENEPQYIIQGKVTDSGGNPISKASVKLISESSNQSIISDDSGNFSISTVAGDLEILSAAWGFKGKSTLVNLANSMNINIELDKGFEDDFFVDLGWTVSSTSTAGKWIRTVPKGTLLTNETANPDADVNSDLGKDCYVTGNDDRSVGFDDIDDGQTILISPIIDISEYSKPQISLSAWFYNGGGNGAPDDDMTIAVTNGIDTITGLTLTKDNGSNGGWRDSLTIEIRELIPTGDNVQLIITASDRPGNGHIVEAGIDKFRLVEIDMSTPTDDQVLDNTIIVSPNPTTDMISINQTNHSLELYDIAGRSVLKNCSKCQSLSMKDLVGGAYILRILKDGTIISSQKIIKL